MPSSRGLRLALVVTVFLALDLAGRARGGEMKLKNGMTFTGTVFDVEMLATKGPQKNNPLPTTVYPIKMAANPLQKYFVPMRQVESETRDIDLSKNEVFKLPPAKLEGGSRFIGVVGTPIEKPPPFDKHGRRIVKLAAKPQNLSVIQSVSEITPDYLKIVASNFKWETAVATSSVTIDVLDPMLRQAIRANDAQQRLRIASFYIQAAMYTPAERELESIGREFPQLADTVRKAQISLTQAKAQDGLIELKLRQRAGQHRFVYETCRNFPIENVDAAVLGEVRAIVTGYEAARDKALGAQARLAELQAELGTDPRVADVAPRRAEISESLNYSNLGRLDAFLKLSDDQKLKPDEKLALALSGWVVGSANAITELDQALKYWQARFLLRDYLRSPGDGGGNDRAAISTKLRALEGVSAQRVAQMLPLLPPALDPAGAQPGKAVRIRVPGAIDDPAVAYSVLLPPEYHSEHQYPLLIALYSEKRPSEQEMTFWTGDETRIGPAQRHGYIVIVPEYTTKVDQTQYEYSPVAHRIVLAALRDARRRFSVDSDRVFLAGHDMGGDAAFDIGLSHPDLFAGVIPIAGISDRYCEYYWENGRQLPLYVVSGEFDRNTVDKNAKELMKMMQHGFNLIYTEYVGAGPDNFYSEIHKLFDWMSRLRRNPLPKKIDYKTLRETDNRFHWLEFEGVPKTVTNIDWTAEKRKAIHPMNVTAMVNEANAIVVSFKADKYRFWLSPAGGLIDFDKRLVVRINSTQRFNDFITPDVGAMLEHVRYHGDRQQLYWAVLEF